MQLATPFWSRIKFDNSHIFKDNSDSILIIRFLKVCVQNYVYNTDTMKLFSYDSFFLLAELRSFTRGYYHNNNSY